MNLINNILDRIAFARELSIAAGVKANLLDLYNGTRLSAIHQTVSKFPILSVRKKTLRKDGKR